MKTFRQRKGLKPVSEVIQTDSMNDELRNSLWNVLHVCIWSSEEFLESRYNTAKIYQFSEFLWFHYFKKRIDSRPPWYGDILKEIREYFYSCEWGEAYEFIEFIVNGYEKEYPDLSIAFNFVLARELSGYRVVSGQITDIVDSQEVEMLETALNDSQFIGATTHLKRALELYANRDQPDYRNSIKESISAVESIASIVANKPGATLAEALRVIEKKGTLHTALKDGFSKLYGYTSDANGIRHSMLDEPELTAADARYFLLSCTSFANYLKAQLP